VLLGTYGSAESRAEYARVLAEWESNGRRLPRSVSGCLTVTETILRYWRWAEEYYLDDQGNPGQELDNLKVALRPLRKLHGHTLAKDFGPLALRAVQEEMVAQAWSRNVINYCVGRIKRCFKWAASCELIPAGVYVALRTVPGIRHGRGAARETQPVKPVRVEAVEAVLPFLPEPVAALVRV
jgi:hypothetical protein